MRDVVIFLVSAVAGYLFAAMLEASGAEAKRLPNYVTGCQALRELNQEHKGRTLSDEEKVVKAQLVTWYKANCNKKAGK
jgi:hypothetical protein